MGVRFRVLWGVLAVVAASTLFPVTAMAQQANANDDELEELQTVQEAFEDEFFDASGNFFRNRGVVGSVTWLLGPFPENNITRDASGVHRLYVSALQQQTQSDPTIRTADLNNPFDTSLLLLPPTQPVRPTAAISGFQTQFPSTQQAPATAPRVSPVRGLW